VITIKTERTTRGGDAKRNEDNQLLEIRRRLALMGNLSDRENDFILCLSSSLGEGRMSLIERGELYALAKANGFSEREVYRYAMDLDLLGFAQAHPILGGKIASLKLTAQGTEYARGLRDQQK
jgi:hypothetical protein